MKVDRSPQDLVSEARKKPRKTSNDIANLERAAELDFATLQNKHFEQKISLQKLWSLFIGILLVISTLAVWTMIFLLGCCRIQYEAYPWLPHTVITSFFAEVIGLGYVVAKYLFPASLAGHS